MSDEAEPGPLVALHNVSAHKLRKASALGGLPMPSLAVVPLGTPFDGFGDITLVAPPSLADPSSGGGARLFSADVYSPRVPDPEWRVDRKAAYALRRALEAVAPDVDDYVSDAEDKADRGFERLAEWLARSPAARLLWLRGVGAGPPPFPRVPTPMERPLSSTAPVRAFFAANPTADLRSEGFAAALREGAAEIAADWRRAGLPEARVGHAAGMADRLLDEGGLVAYGALHGFERDRRSQLERPDRVDTAAAGAILDDAVRANGADAFEAWVEARAGEVCRDPRVKVGSRMLPYTVGNVVAAMRRQALRGSEEGPVFSLGRARSLSARPLASLDAAARLSGRIVSEEGFKEAKEANDARFFALAERLADRYEGISRDHHNQTTRRMEGLDDLSRAMFRWFAGPRTEEAMARCLRASHYEGATPEEVAAAAGFARDLADMPTTYFEAKQGRAVDLSEFAAAAIPEDAPAATEALLRSAGIRHVSRYPEGGRTEAVEALALEVGAVHGPPPARGRGMEMAGPMGR